MMSDSWNPEFISFSRIFNSIKFVASDFSGYKQWPDLTVLKQVFKKYKMTVVPVAQAAAPEAFEDHYEPRIFLKGELQTRMENWHDFFNAMVWLQFNKIKKALNQLHYYSALNREQGSNRSPLENAITLFDECGCVLISDSDDLLELVRQHKWHELFWQKRHLLDAHLQCIVVGHAMFEKALAPYVGMTSHAILISSASLLQSAKQEKYETIDQKVADLWLQNKIISSQDLHAFPLLGMPSWHIDNHHEEFYLNTDYFRPKSNRGKTSKRLHVK